MSGFWDAINAAAKAWKEPSPVTTTSLNPAVQALATDATLVNGIVALIVQAYPITSPFSSIIEAATRGALGALVNSVATGVSSGALVPTGGGFVSKGWADDPRHALNPDGTFKAP